MVGTRPTKTRPDVAVGQLLTRARIQRGVSLTQIAGELHIPARHLQALEDGDLSVFPAEVYAHGAFTKYAEYLGIRTRTVQRAFRRVLTGAREYVPLRVHTPQPYLAALITPRRIWAVAIATVAAVVGSYIGWQVMVFVRLPSLEITAPDSPLSADTSLTVRGRAAADATVLVNREQVLLDTNGLFATELTLHPGINVLLVEAVNAAGRTRTLRREVLVPRS